MAQVYTLEHPGANPYGLDDTRVDTRVPPEIYPVRVLGLILGYSQSIQLLTNIDLLRGDEKPSFFSLSILTSRHSPLRSAERARMPETALFSPVMFFFLH